MIYGWKIGNSGISDVDSGNVMVNKKDGSSFCVNI